MLKQHPDDAQILKTAALSYYLQAILQQGLGNNPATLSAYQLAMGSAEKSLNNSHDKAPAFADLLAIVNSYTAVLSTQKQSDKITALQQRVLALPLSEAGLLMARAEWAKGLGNQAAVDKDLLLAATLADRSNASELNSVGYSLATLSNQYQAAYPLLKLAITLKPDDANIMDSVAWVLHKLGKNQVALAYLQAATCKKDQMSPAANAELSSHKHAVLSALGKAKEPPLTCLQVQVQKVLAGSQGETLGIQAGDVLVSYNGKAITSTAEFIKGREQEKPGTAPKKLSVLRQGKTLSFDIKVGKIGAELKDVDITPPLPEL